MSDACCSTGVVSCDCAPFDVGSVVTVTFNLYDTSTCELGDADPVVRLKLPDGSTSLPTVEHDDVGVYHIAWTATQPGQYRWRLETTDPFVVVLEGAFLVAASAVLA